MMQANDSPEVVYIGYSAAELAEQVLAEAEAMAELAALAAKWKRRAEREALERAVTAMADSLASKGPLAPGRELPFMLDGERPFELTRRASRKPATGIRRRSARPVYMSVAPAALAGMFGG